MTWKAFHTNFVEFCVYLLLSIGSVRLCFYFLYEAPVIYTRLITEDNWVEFATAVFFALAGVLLLLLSRHSTSRFQKVIWIGIGVFAIFIAGEEISWGQHLFKWSVPEELRKINYQKEINIHNLDVLYPVNRKLNDYLCYLIPSWSLLSALILIAKPRWASRIQAYGIPLIPVKLIPIFLTAPYFFRYFPNFRADEIGELFLGMAAAFWVVDLYASTVPADKVPAEAGKAVLRIGGVLSAVATLSIILTYQFSRWPNVRILDQMAYVYYAKNHLYRQALRLYEYIYAHPSSVTPDIPIHYGTILIATGNRAEAKHVLSVAAAEMEVQDPPERKMSEHLRRLIKVHTLLGDSGRADAWLKRAIDFETERMNALHDPNERAERLWSIARDWEARGSIYEALNIVDEARETASSPYLLSKMERWRAMVVKSQTNAFNEEIVLNE